MVCSSVFNEEVLDERVALTSGSSFYIAPVAGPTISHPTRPPNMDIGKTKYSPAFLTNLPPFLT